MTNTVTGFLTINSFIANEGNVVNPVGELRPKSLTFDRDPKLFNNSFGSLVVFDSTIDAEVVSLFQDAVIRTNDNFTSAVELAVGYGSINDGIAEELPDLYANVTFGPSVNNPVDDLDYPAWVSFTAYELDVHWEFKVWLTDLHFSTEYEKTTLEPVYPIDNLQTLYSNFDGVRGQIEALDATSMVDRADDQLTEVRTGTTSYEVKVFNIQGDNSYFTMPILVAYNGRKDRVTKGDMLVILKEVLLAGGDIDFEIWAEVIPDLNPLDNYTIIPAWGNIAVDSLGSAAPLYSPVVPLPFDLATLGPKYFPSYTPEELAELLNYVPAAYKSLGLLVIPDVNNPDGTIEWRTKFADYMVLAINDIHIQQLAVPTRDVIVGLDRLIRVAESYAADTSLASDFKMFESANGPVIYTVVGGIRLNMLTRIGWINDQ